MMNSEFSDLRQGCGYDTCAKCMNIASQFKSGLLSESDLNRSSCSVICGPRSATWEPEWGTPPVQPCCAAVSGQWWDTLAGGNLLSASTGGEQRDSNEWAIVREMEQHLFGLLCHRKWGKKWKHISPLTAAVDLPPPCPPLRWAAYDVVRRRGGLRGCPRGSLFLVRD